MELTTTRAYVILDTLDATVPLTMTIVVLLLVFMVSRGLNLKQKKESYSPVYAMGYTLWSMMMAITWIKGLFFVVVLFCFVFFFWFIYWLIEWFIIYLFFLLLLFFFFYREMYWLHWDIQMLVWSRIQWTELHNWHWRMRIITLPSRWVNHWRTKQFCHMQTCRGKTFSKPIAERSYTKQKQNPFYF